MSFTYEDRRADSPYVDRIWHIYTTSPGVYTAGLDGNWDIIISKSGGTVSVTVNGVGKEATEVPYEAGVESVGIAFKPGVFLRDFKGKDIVDRQHTLTEGVVDYVEIGGSRFVIPGFETADSFVNELVKEGILLIDPIVASFEGGQAPATSGRTLRRHIARTTGLSPYAFHQIQRAQYAVWLLQSGTPIAQAAIDAGYSDQAHMTKALKLLIGATPAQIISRRNQ